ncbi:hypothetical protein RhiirB3_393275 [Rhizophagus irregularis]|nr:hypothetical protein RhiirB3_393275 [Rhizophagus irregularis]
MAKFYTEWAHFTIGLYLVQELLLKSHWYDWYGVEIAHAIKRYVRIGCELTSGQDIERAIEELSGTSVAQIEPNRNKNNENMVLEKSWISIIEDFLPDLPPSLKMHKKMLPLPIDDAFL